MGFVIWLSVLVASSAAAPSDWYACQRDGDCVVTQGACTAVAVNAKHKAAHQEKISFENAKIGPMVDCATSTARFKAVCDGGQCVVRPKKRPGRR